MLLILALVWGGSFFFNGLAVRELPVLSVVVARVGLAAAMLLIVMWWRGERMPRGRRVLASFVVMGMLNNAVPYALIVGGQQHIGAGVASILNAATPIFTVVLAHLLTRDERMTRAKLLGVLIGFAGVAVMVGAGVRQEAGFHVLAHLMCLGGALSYALAGLYGRRFSQMNISPLGAAAGQVTASALIPLPAVLVLDQPWALPPPSLTAIAALAGVAALSTALAYLLYFRLLATAGATNLLLVTFLIPVSAILLGTLFLGERLLPRHILGMVLIGGGLAAIDGRVWRRA